MTFQDPLWMQGNSYSAATDRHLFAALGGNAGGISGYADCKVTQRGAGANVSVDIASGYATVPGAAGPYQAWNNATINLTGFASAPGAGNFRHDLIVVTARDAETAGTDNDTIPVIVTGTASGSPVDPAVPAYSLVLARVRWSSSTTSITNGIIDDLRLAALRPSAIVGTLPALGRTGQIISTNDGAVWAWNGSVWAELPRMTQNGFNYSTISDHLNMGTTAATYGSLTIADPGHDVIIQGHVSCNAISVSGSVAWPGLTVRISLDGGTSWAYSPELIGSTTSLTPVALTQFMSVAGTPSGDIVIQGRIVSENPPGVHNDFTNGSMQITTTPTQ